MKVKQIIGVMLVCIIVATTFISCSASGTQSSQANRETNGGASTDTSLAVNDQGLAPMADADTPITFKVFVRDPGTAPAKDNPVIAKIQELTGVTIQYEYLVGDLEQKLGVMIAGGDYPDAIFAGDSNKKLIEAGAFIPLQDEIVKYKNLNDMYGSVLDTMRSEDGNTYSMELFAVSDTIPTFQNGGAGFFIQKAVLEEFGYPTVKTIDEYFDLIQKYQEKYPEIDGVKTIGFEVLCDYLNPKQLLDDIRLLCRGKSQPIKEVYSKFNDETNDGRDMAEMSELLSEAIDSIIDTKEESDIDSLFSAGGTSALMSDISGLEDFELISFIVVK